MIWDFNCSVELHVRKVAENSIALDCSEKKEKGFMASRQKSELQMLEASRRSYRMTRAINRQPRVPILDERPQCNGNNFLKSTLDLQESLIMLGKLQAMNNVSQAATRNLMEEIEIEIIRSELGQASKRQAVHRCNNRLLEGRLCSGRCWRSSDDEPEKVIRGSNCARSILSNSSDDEKAASIRSHASFASSRFSVYNEVERDSDSSSTWSQQSMRMGTPNLIARLMGLDEVPSAAIQPEEDNSMPQGLMMFSTEASEVTRKPTLVDRKLRSRRGTLFDIIERERLERSWRIQQVSDSGVCSSDSSSSRLPEEESYLQEETQCMSGSKETHCIKREKFQEYYPSNENFVQKKGRESEPFRISQKTELKASMLDEKAKWITSYKTVSYEGFHEHQTPDKVSSQQIILDDAHELSKERKRTTIIRKLEETKVELSQKTKKPASLYHMQNRKEAVKSSKQANPSQNPERNKVKPVQLPDTTTAKQSTGLLDQRSSVIRKASSPVKHCGMSQPKSELRNSSTPPRRKQNEKNPAQKKFNTAKPVKKKDVTTISTSCKKVALIRNTSCVDQHRQGMGHDMKSSITEKMRKDQKVVYEVRPKGSKVRQPCKLENKTVSYCIDTSTKTSEVEDFKGLFLKNRSFLTHANELCGHASHTLSKENESPNEEVKDGNLYLAYANELIAQQLYKIELSKHPMSTMGMKLSAHASPDQLVGAISTGIRTLCNYNKVVDDDDVPNGILYVRSRKDVECKEMMLNSMWDVDWWNGISIDEADRVVIQVEKAILFSLVEDTVMALLHRLH